MSRWSLPLSPTALRATLMRLVRPNELPFKIGPMTGRKR
jgi:hypothetical protein